MTVLLAIVPVLVYLTIGLGVARLARPSLIANHTYRRGDPFLGIAPGCVTVRAWQTREADGLDRAAIARATRRLALAWPVTGAVHLVSRSLNRAMDKADPAVHERQRRCIAELERELKI